MLSIRALLGSRFIAVEMIDHSIDSLGLAGVDVDEQRTLAIKMDKHTCFR